MAEPQESLHFLDYWRVLCSRKEIVMAVSLLVVLTGVLVTFTMPKVYRASVIIAVKEDTPDVAVFNQEAMRYDPLFLRTQFEIIQSAPVIEEVIERLDLHRKLAKSMQFDDLPLDRQRETAFKIVSRSMKVQQYRDTNLIEIQMYLSEPKETAPQEAANTANMIAEVYRDQNARRSRTAIEGGLRALHESLEEQRQRVGQAEALVEEVRQKYQIDVGAAAANQLGAASLQKLELQHLVAQEIGARLELEDKKARFEQIMKVSHDELVAASQYLVRDPALMSLVAEKRKAEVQKESLLRASLGPRHPDVLGVEALITELNAKIDDALVGVKQGVEADYRAAKAKFDALTARLQERKAEERGQESTSYREFQKANEELDHARKIRDALEIRYIQENIEQRIPRTTVEVIEPATPAEVDDPVSPDIVLNIILSIIVGLGSGIGLAYFVEYLDTSVKTIEDVERYLKLPVLGVIPQKVKPLNDEAADPAHAEAYRVLRTNLQFSERRKDGKAICVTSGSVGEGKSLTLFNLAAICAQLGDRILIVDTDLHRPRQHKILNVSNRRGVANILVGEAHVDDVLIHTPLKGLDFLPSGKLSSGVHGLLDTLRMKQLVEEVKARYDFVFFDSPPIIGVSDASLLAREMDGVLLVVQHRKHPKAVSGRAKDMVHNVGGNLLGVVLNNINISRDYSYYYQHYYSYPKTYVTSESA